MKYLKYVLLLLLLQACTDYDGETRLVYELRVTDANGNPVANRNVSINVNNDFSSDKISDGITDANGQLRLVFPAPQNANIDISIAENDDTYYRTAYYNILRTDFIDFKLSQDVTLFRDGELTYLQIIPNNTSGSYSLAALRVEGLVFEDATYWHLEPNPDTPAFALDYRPRKNQTVHVIYTLRNTGTGQETVYDVPVAIGNEPVNYSLNY